MKKNITLIFTLLILGLLVFYQVVKVLDFAPRYIYPLDDAYIHLSMAKNFAEYGNWGITQYGFSSTTSSPLFTFLLAVCIKLFGNWEYTPLVVNGLAAIGLMLVFHQYLKRYSKTTQWTIMMSVVLLMPLHLMIMTGMEHVLHALAMVGVLTTFQSYLTKREPRNFSFLGIMSIIATGLRYESLFFVLFICIYLFFIKKEYVQSIALGVLALCPVIFYGLISLDKGSYFLPNSLILKGNTNDGLYGFFMRVAGNAYRGISVLILILILVSQIVKHLSYRGETLRNKLIQIPIPFVVFGGFVLHLLFANFGWLIRYEAYIVILILYAIVPYIDTVFQSVSKKKISGSLVLSMLLVVFFFRFINIFDRQSQSSKNIFDQQIQLADFIHEYYLNSRVIANDIGAITYFNNIFLLDTYGLGSIEVAKLRKDDHGKFLDNKKLQSYVAHVAYALDFEIAVVYEDWVKMPDYFTKVGSISIKDNYICGGTTVSFFAVKKEHAERLRKQLMAFSSRLPQDVIVNIIN